MTAQAPALHRTLAVLAPPRRFQLMLLLLSGPVRSVSQLAKAVRLSQSCTTRHLQALERTGLVKRERDGKRVLFRPRPRDATARAVLESLEAMAGLKPGKRLDPVLAAGLALGAIPVASAAEFEVADERSPEPPARPTRRNEARSLGRVAAVAGARRSRRGPSADSSPDDLGPAMPPPVAEVAQADAESAMKSAPDLAPVARWAEIEDFLL